MKKILSLAVACVLICAQGSPLALASGSRILSQKNSPILSVNSIENDIVRMQKDFVGQARHALELVSKEGVKEIGDMEFGVKSNSEASSSEFLFKLHDYKSTSNFLKGSAEMSGKIEFSVVLSGSRYDYSKQLPKSEISEGTSYEEGLESIYEKVPMNLDAHVAFDVNVVVDRKFIYFTISTPVASATGTSVEVSEFNEKIVEASKYTGKTYKIATDGTMEFSFVSTKNKIQSVLNVLEKQSLLEPKKRNADGSYFLDIKRSTLQSMNVAMGRKKNANLEGLELGTDTLAYRKEDGKTALRLNISKSQTKKMKDRNYVLLENSGTDYVLSGEVYEKNMSPYNKNTSQLNFRIARNSAIINASVKNSWEKSSMNLQWDGNNFLMKATSGTGNLTPTSILVEGIVNIDTKTLNLTAKNGGSKIATLQMSPQ